MYASGSLLLGTLFAALSVTNAAPPSVPFNSSGLRGIPPPCNANAIAEKTLPYAFTLSALYQDSPLPWSVVFQSPRSSKGEIPIITRTNAEKPIFRLIEGQLTTGGQNSDELQAFFGPAPPVFPPYPDELFFDTKGSGDGYDLENVAVNRCDVNGTPYVGLRNYERNNSLSNLSPCFICCFWFL